MSTDILTHLLDSFSTEKITISSKVMKILVFLGHTEDHKQILIMY